MTTIRQEAMNKPGGIVKVSPGGYKIINYLFGDVEEQSTLLPECSCLNAWLVNPIWI